jgi:hypothetical protein
MVSDIYSPFRWLGTIFLSFATRNKKYEGNSTATRNIEGFCTKQGCSLCICHVPAGRIWNLRDALLEYCHCATHLSRQYFTSMGSNPAVYKTAGTECLAFSTLIGAFLHPGSFICWRFLFWHLYLKPPVCPAASVAKTCHLTRLRFRFRFWLLIFLHTVPVPYIILRKI